MKQNKVYFTNTDEPGVICIHFPNGPKIVNRSIKNPKKFCDVLNSVSNLTRYERSMISEYVINHIEDL